MTARQRGTARAVITGIGVAAPTGVGRSEHWKNTLGRESGIRPLPDEVAGTGPVRVAGLVEGFAASGFIPRTLAVQTDRWTWLALAAAELAIADAELTAAPPDPYRWSVVTASSSGGNSFGQREIQALWRDGGRAVSAYQSIAWFYAASTGQISIRHGLKGRCGVTVADGAGGMAAVASALAGLRRGGVDAVLVGGTEAPLSPYAVACHASLDTVSRQSDPVAAYRPFTTRACGFVPGEGGALMVLEEVEAARRRSAPAVYAEVAGVACTQDAHHPTRPPSSAAYLARAIGQAVERAGLTPDDIDVVFPDALGDPRWDALEVDALRAVFGARLSRVPVSVPKTMTGRLNAGGAPLDLAWAALAVFHDVVPPMAESAGWLGPPAFDLDLVTDARENTGLRNALVVARGVGGFNAAAVLRSVGGVRR